MADLTISALDAIGAAHRCKVTAYLSDAQGEPVMGWVASGGAGRMFRYVRHTASDGTATLDLTPNASITPANTCWTVVLESSVNRGESAFRKTFTKGSGTETLMAAAAAVDVNLGSGTRLVDLFDVDVVTDDLEDGDIVEWDGTSFSRSERLSDAESNIDALQQRWQDTAAHTHAHYAGDATVAPSAGLFDETGLRVTSWPDLGSSGAFPALADDGTYAALMTSPPGDLPGPLFIASSPRFNGAPCLYFDELENHVLDLLPGDPPAHSMLANAVGTSFPGDGYDMPWGCVVVGRAGEVASSALIDCFLGGGPTIGEDNNEAGEWGIATDIPDLWPSINIPIDLDESVCIILNANAGTSTVDFYHWVDGVWTHEPQVAIALTNRTDWEDYFLGYHSKAYLVALGIKTTGVYTAAEIAAMSEWAKHRCSTGDVGLERELAFEDRLGDFLPLAGGAMDNGATLGWPISSVSQFLMGAQDVLGAKLLQLLAPAHSLRNLMSWKAAAVGLAVVSVNDSLNVVKGAGQSTEVIGGYTGATLEWAVRSDWSMHLKHISAPSAPAAGYTLFWADSGGKLFRRINGGAATSLLDNSHFTAKGDILAGTAANAHSPVALGGDGEVLTADPSFSAGVKWKDVRPIREHAGGANAVSSTSELTLLASTLTIAANSLVAGDVLHVRIPVFWTNTSGSASTLTLRPKIASTTLLTKTSASLASGNNLDYVVEIYIYILTLGSSGSAAWDCEVRCYDASGLVAGNCDGANSNVFPMTINTTSAIEIDLTGQLSVNHANNNAFGVRGVLRRDWFAT